MHPEAASPGPPGLLEFPQKERPLAPQRGSHPEGRRLFQAGPEGVESDISEGCGLASLRGLVPGVPGTSSLQWLDLFQPLPAPFPIWERRQVFGWGFQMKLMPRSALGSRALGRCWESNGGQPASLTPRAGNPPTFHALTLHRPPPQITLQRPRGAA